MIWGLTLEPGKIYTRVMGDEIQLSMASLESRADYGDESDGYSHVVMKTTKSEYLLCTLVHGLTFQQNLDLKLRPKETVTFSVQGSSVVYLMGYSVTDSEVEDQIDIEDLEEDSVNEMVEFEEGVIVEGESPTGHSGPNEDEDNEAMSEVELNRHRDQLESRDMNPPSTSSDVQIEITGPDEFSTEESPSVNVIKVEETLRLKEEPERDMNQRIIDEEASLEESEDIVPTGIQRNPAIQGHGMDPQTTAGPHSTWVNPSFERHQPDLQPVLPEVASVSSLQTARPQHSGIQSQRYFPKNESGNTFVTSGWSNPSEPRDLVPSSNVNSRGVDRGSPFRCNFCEASFGNRSDWSKHERQFHKQKSPQIWPCRYCNLIAKTRTEILNHERTHTGGKIFLCNVCHKSFSRRWNLIRHYRCHAKKHPCRFCGETFDTISLKENHEQTQH